MDDRRLFDDLWALAESAFPKRCENCGRIFQSAAEFIKQTENVSSDVSGLKESVSPDGASVIVELFRNCPCGSTLMDAFNNRRDMSAQGDKRRKRFGDLIEYLHKNHGMDIDTARVELLKVMKGQKSDLLAGIEPPPE